ncbi:MAG: hypothetical protein EB059_04920 [Alphaproteobacteria bacterium]|nr:hypothetical protein [Alphaproteobacteria bacterium]
MDFKDFTFDSKKFFEKNLPYIEEQNATVDEVAREVQEGLRVLSKIKEPIIGIFGSHRARANHADFQHCHSLCTYLARSGYAIITGGGSGVMHAANKAAHEQGAISVGMTSNLLTKEHIFEPVYSYQPNFRFFFVRRFVLSIKTAAKVFYPGGSGTLNELFEYAMLMNNNIVDRVPIICVGSDFWSGLFDWMETTRSKRDYLQAKQFDRSYFTLLDSQDDIISTITRYVPVNRGVDL